MAARNNNARAVQVKDYPMRNRLMGVFSFPLLILTSTLVAIPFIFLNLFTITTGILLTAVAEILVIMLALNYTDSLGQWKTKLRLDVKPSWKQIGAGLGIGAVLLVLLQVIAFSMQGLGGIEDSDTSSSLGALSGFERYLILLLFVPIVIPFIEEVFFRSFTLGFIKDSFRSEKTGVLWGLIVSSVVFGLAHFQGMDNLTDVVLLVWTGFVGFVNGMLLLKTNSVYPAFASHFSYNGLTVVITLLAT